MSLVCGYSDLLNHRSSRLILVVKQWEVVPDLALDCRFMLIYVPCLSFFCTNYMNDKEKQSTPNEMHRVHLGVIWSEETNKELLEKLRISLCEKIQGQLVREPSWEHFDSSEPNFIIHCLAREYGDFILTASDSKRSFEKNSFDGIHLIYNQLILLGESGSPQIGNPLFFEKLHGHLTTHDLKRQ